MTSPTELKRSIGLTMILFYGLGTIIGAGIYVLIGEVAAVAGMAAPVAFVIAALLAALTAFSYAELVARFPLSAGEAVYVAEGFSRTWLTRTTGLAVVLIGCVSAATIANGFAGYFREFIELPPPLIVSLLVLGLGAIAVWGVKESVSLAACVTLLEVGGLLWIVWLARGDIATLPLRWDEINPLTGRHQWGGILFGALLAFYAFIGFEDMVNMSEEVRRPRRTLPLAIAVVMLATAVIYGAVAIAAVLAVPPAELAQSEAPLAEVYRRTTGGDAVVITLISLLAVVNGALIQIIMASRVMFGMAKQGWIWPVLRTINSKTRTPLLATSLVSGLVLLLALFFPLVTLAEITSLLTLSVFALVNGALIRIKRRGVGTTEDIFRVPTVLPWLGFVVTVGFIVYQFVIKWF